MGPGDTQLGVLWCSLVKCSLRCSYLLHLTSTCRLRCWTLQSWQLGLLTHWTMAASLLAQVCTRLVSCQVSSWSITAKMVHQMLLTFFRCCTTMYQPMRLCSVHGCTVESNMSCHNQHAIKSCRNSSITPSCTGCPVCASTHRLFGSWLFRIRGMLVIPLLEHKEDKLAHMMHVEGSPPKSSHGAQCALHCILSKFLLTLTSGTALQSQRIGVLSVKCFLTPHVRRPPTCFQDLFCTKTISASQSTLYLASKLCRARLV